MIVAMCCTRNWYTYLAAGIYALFKHNKVKKLYLFIEDDEIPQMKDKRIQFININKLPEYITKDSPNYKTKYTKMSYLRCYFTKVLSCDKLIYVDADAIVIDNIEELWNLEVDTIAGVKEPGEWSRHLGIPDMDDKYINSGVLVMNLKNIREQHLDDKMIELLNKNKYAFPDQDVINITFKDKQYLSNKYNSTETTGFRDDAKIIHYIRERKGWIRQSPRSEIWFKYYNEMIGGSKMIRVEVIKDFTLGDFNKIKDTLVRKSKNKENNLFVGDTFECDKNMVEYLTGKNGYHDVFVKVIEVKPELEEPVERIGYAQVKEALEEVTKEQAPKAEFLKEATPSLKITKRGRKRK